MHNHKQPKLLIVDDEDYTRLLYEENFKRSGYSVSLATNGSEAVATVKKEKPDLVILDLGLSTNDGFETMAAIRAENPNLPVIINTNYAHFRADIRSWIADAFMIKSSNIEELLTKTSELLSYLPLPPMGPSRRRVSITEKPGVCEGSPSFILERMRSDGRRQANARARNNGGNHELSERQGKKQTADEGFGSPELDRE